MTNAYDNRYINGTQPPYNRTQRASAASSVRSSAYGARGNVGAREKTTYGAGDYARDLLKELGALALKKWQANWRDLHSLSRIYIVKSKKRKPLPVSAVGYIVVFTLVAAFLVLGNTRINEANLAASNLRAQITAEQKRADELKSVLNMRTDASEIDAYATSVLGMVKTTDVAKSYVSITGEDKIVTSGHFDTTAAK